MSSIIDALKKSDKDRNKGESSSVQQINFSNDKPPESRKRFWFFVAFLLVVLLAVLAWQQGWHQALSSQIRTFFGHTETADQTSTEGSVIGGENTDKEQNNQTQNNNDTTNRLVPPNANDIKLQSAAVNNQAKEKAEPLPEPAAVDKQKEQPQIDLSNSEVNNLDETITPIQTDADNQPNSNQNSINAKDVSIEQAQQQDYLLVYQLPFEVRKNLPPIKLNVHIYDPDPDNRMILLNGTKYVAGDMIEDLVEIKAINQEGVVLIFEGMEFIVPK